MLTETKQWLLKVYQATFSLDNPSWWHWWLGAVGVILVLIILWRFRSARQNFRVFRDESGVAETTNAALRDLVRIACSGVETASKPKIKFKKSHGRINVHIRAKLYQGQRLSEVRDQMRRRVTKIFQDTHGILVGDVSFTATGFKKGGDSPAIVEEPESVYETAHEKKVAPEPEAEKKPEKKAFGWSEPKPPAKEESKPSSSATAEAKPKEESLKPDESPKEDESSKKKGGLFGGFGSKKSDKNEPEIVEDKPKKQGGDPLEDDEFSSLLAENDPKPNDKKK